MVSALCSVSNFSGSAMKSGTRNLRLDPKKDYTVPLQVETSVEYDLPSHIYPPKGASPILMIHPSYTEQFKSKKHQVESPSLLVKPLSKSCPTSFKRSEAKVLCNCGCNTVKTKVSNPNIYQSILQYEQPRNIYSKQPTASFLSKHDHSSKQQFSQVEQQKQLLKEQFYQYSLQKYQRKMQPAVGTIAPAQSDFLPPVLPSSFLARTTTRGIAGGSPKLRAARSRRGINVASNVNLPEYLALTRPSRSAGTANCQSLNNSQHLWWASCPGSNMQVSMPHRTSELDLIQSFTPYNQLVPSNSKYSSTKAAFPTVGQSVDSGCSLASDYVVGSTNLHPYYGSTKPMEGIFRKPAIDSGFSTPVDLPEDVTMENFEGFTVTTPTSVRNVTLNSVLQDVFAEESAQTYQNNSAMPTTILNQHSLHTHCYPPYNLVC